MISGGCEDSDHCESRGREVTVPDHEGIKAIEAVRAAMINFGLAAKTAIDATARQILSIGSCDISDSREPEPTPSPSNASRQCDSSES